MKSLLAVLAAWALLVTSVHAQIGAVSIQAGTAFSGGTTRLETTIRLSCSTKHNGACIDVNVGADWGRRDAAGLLSDLDVGYSATFSAKRQTSLVGRVGFSCLCDEANRMAYTGINGGIALRHLYRPKRAWRVDFTWRRLSGLPWPSLVVGLEAS
jgi:hypothetical protein